MLAIRSGSWSGTRSDGAAPFPSAAVVRLRPRLRPPREPRRRRLRAAASASVSAVAGGADGLSGFDEVVGSSGCGVGTASDIGVLS